MERPTLTDYAHLIFTLFDKFVQTNPVVLQYQNLCTYKDPKLLTAHSRKSGQQWPGELPRVACKPCPAACLHHYLAVWFIGGRYFYLAAYHLGAAVARLPASKRLQISLFLRLGG